LRRKIEALKMAPMAAGLPVALGLLAATAAYGPAPPAQPKPAAKAPVEACTDQQPNANTREIVICAQRPNGYRLDPDIMEAKKESRESLAVRQKTPIEKMTINECAFSCYTGSPDLLAAAIGAVTMAKRLAEGKEVGSMFVTRPQPDEYHRYLAAKHRREARQAAAKAAAIVAAAKAQQAQARTADNSAKP
jgi:hypothetical protein